MLITNDSVLKFIIVYIIFCVYKFNLHMLIYSLFINCIMENGIHIICMKNEFYI